jgi:diguanylate cyclase
MNANDFNRLNLRVWNRKFLNAFWYALLITVVAEEMYFTVSGIMSWDTQLRFMVLPTGISIGIMGAAELLYRRMSRGFPYVTLLTAASICAVVIWVHFALDYIQCLLILPILIATFYYNRYLVYFASALSIAAFLLLTYFQPGLYERTSPGEWVSMPMILLVATLIALSVMQRGVELLNELSIESSDRQNLMIQNVIKDKMVRTDPLTGLYNRAALYEHLDMLLRYAESEGFSLHVAMFDIDRFKSVNDTFGHHVGDVVLKRVSAVIRDGVGIADFAARYGGEEFMAVFTERTLEEVHAALEKIRRDVEVLEHPELEGRNITVSIGLYPYGKGMDKDVLIEQADFCLYRAKRSGRNTIVFSKN